MPSFQRGDRGDRGVSGERGPKGDHGQHGTDGQPGAPGKPGAAGATGRTAGIGLFLVMIVVMTVLAYGVSDRASTAARREARHYTQKLARKGNRASEQRSVNNCRRSNPSRAYLRLRADEFRRTDQNASSFTTNVAPEVLAILNCSATVRNHGVPVPLPDSVQRTYLRMFRARKVPITRENAIIDYVPFERYFSGHGPTNP